MGPVVAGYPARPGTVRLPARQRGGDRIILTLRKQAELPRVRGAPGLSRRTTPNEQDDRVR
jgi:hypothetical protein